MQKTILKKLLVCAVAVCTILAMSVTAFAAADLTGGIVSSNDTDLNIGKTLNAINPTLDSIDGPGASYSYAIAGVAPSASNGGLTVSDGSHTTNVSTGPADGVTLTTSSVAFPVGTALNASAAGTANTKNIVAHTDLSKFTTPGVYRYEITETPNLGTTGVVDNGARKRYLDVYIVNDTTGLKVAGYALRLADGTKTNAFDDATYETVNITLKKTVSGDLGDKTNQFPFSGTVEDNGRYFYAKKGEAPTAAAANQIAGAAAGSAISTTLAHDEMYYIAGISKTAMVSYTETNNTSDTYQTSITGGTASAASAVAPAATKSMTATAAQSASAVVFNNALAAITPTGVILRFGAPLALIVVGAALVALNRRTKKSEN